MQRKCSRPSFTEQQFKIHEKSYWAMPARWATDESAPPILRMLWREGRSGAIGLLPLLGQYARHPKADRWAFSFEELSRLSGCSPATIAKGAGCLGENRLATSSPSVRFGRYVSVWNILPAITAERSAHAITEPYFYFPSRWIFGGQWARLSGPQQLLLLAVGAHSREYSDDPLRNPLMIAAGANMNMLGDLQLCYDRPSGGSVRLACISYSELQHSTGLSKEAIRRALGAFRCPDLWPGSGFVNREYPFRLLRVYPTGGGSLIYLVRDHAPPYPFDFLNALASNARETSEAS